MAEQPRPDDLAQLRARLDIQEARSVVQQAEIARLKRRRHFPRRFLPLAIVALLVALVPLAGLAAGPTFNDLNAGSVHNANIQAIADAGITKGCDPGVSYCPNGLVTREEMASFLARTAGLGGNPAVANAKTAQTADTATNATNAAHATSADTATNAAALGGQPPSAYLPASGTTTLRYPGITAIGLYSNPLGPNGYGGATVTAPASTTVYVLVPLSRPTAQYGRFLAITAVRVCYRATSPGIRITNTGLYASERGADDNQTLVNDNTARAATTDQCYDLAVAPQAVAGMAYLYLYITNGPGATRYLDLDSFALTLTPLAAGAAEVPPVADPNAPAKP